MRKKMVEPCSRMKRSSDKSQKTIVILLGIFSILPPLLSVIKFWSGCLVACNDAYDARFGKDIAWGFGAICFMINLALQIPIYVIHISIPSGVSTARNEVPLLDDAPTEATALVKGSRT